MLLSAHRVGPAGKAFGLDMTDEMLNLARDNAAKAGATNAEFLKGHIESIPLPREWVDVIISNCVINLSGNKAAVFAESFRVLRPGGRFGASDVLADDHLTAAERTERGRHVGCIAGALSFTEYRDGLTRAGFTGISITPTHKVPDRRLNRGHHPGHQNYRVGALPVPHLPPRVTRVTQDGPHRVQRPRLATAMRVAARVGGRRAGDRGVVEHAGDPGHAVPGEALREDPRHLLRCLRVRLQPARPPPLGGMGLVRMGPALASRYP